jgi:hypothetical protein
MLERQEGEPSWARFEGPFHGGHRIVRAPSRDGSDWNPTENRKPFLVPVLTAHAALKIVSCWLGAGPAEYQTAFPVQLATIDRSI